MSVHFLGMQACGIDGTWIMEDKYIEWLFFLSLIVHPVLVAFPISLLLELAFKKASSHFSTKGSCESSLKRWFVRIAPYLTCVAGAHIR